MYRQWGINAFYLKPLYLRSVWESVVWNALLHKSLSYVTKLFVVNTIYAIIPLLWEHWFGSRPKLGGNVMDH
jgi:hypothetical protein